MKIIRDLAGIILLAALSATLPAPSSSGHGGQYIGPGDIVPPNLGGKNGGHGHKDTDPERTGGKGTSTGAPGARRGLGPTLPNPARTPRGTRTGLSRARQDRSPDRWENWWELNKEPYLSCLDQLIGGQVVTSAAGHLLGKGDVAAVLRRVSPERLRDEVVPALLDVLEESDGDLVDSAVLALGRIVGCDEADRVFDRVVGVLRHPRDSARESATLALGVLGSSRARPLLHELLLDSRRGRQRLGGGGSVPTRIRAFAALALGMIGDREDVDLLASVSCNPRVRGDLAGCAVIALGRMQGVEEQVVPLLAELLDARQTDRVVRALVPIALGRLGPSAASTVPRLVAAARSDFSDNDLVRSSLIALGKLAAPTDTEVSNLLQSVARDHHDRPARHFALIALGRIASRAVLHGSRDHDGRRARTRFLLGELTHPADRLNASWAGLALGMVLHAEASSDAPVSTTALRTLRECFVASRDPSHRGALAIALGLAGTREATNERLAAMLKTRTGPFRGYLALSLGLSHAAVSAQLHQALSARALAPAVRLNLARGLALTRYPGATSMLIDLLTQVQSTAEKAGMAQAIGLIGDGRATAPLIALLEDHHNPGILRGFAAVALGRLGEKTPLPWNTPFAEGMNFHCCPGPLREVLDIL